MGRSKKARRPRKGKEKEQGFVGDVHSKASGKVCSLEPFENNITKNENETTGPSNHMASMVKSVHKDNKENKKSVKIE